MPEDSEDSDEDSEGVGEEEGEGVAGVVEGPREPFGAGRVGEAGRLLLEGPRVAVVHGGKRLELTGQQAMAMVMGHLRDAAAREHGDNVRRYTERQAGRRGARG